MRLTSYKAAVYIKIESKMCRATIDSITEKVCLAIIARITIAFIYTTRIINCTKMFISNSWDITTIKLRMKAKVLWTIVWSAEKAVLTFIMSIAISLICSTWIFRGAKIIFICTFYVNIICKEVTVRKKCELKFSSSSLTKKRTFSQFKFTPYPKEN